MPGPILRARYVGTLIASRITAHGVESSNCGCLARDHSSLVPHAHLQRAHVCRHAQPCTPNPCPTNTTDNPPPRQEATDPLKTKRVKSSPDLVRPVPLSRRSRLPRPDHDTRSGTAKAGLPGRQTAPPSTSTRPRSAVAHGVFRSSRPNYTQNLRKIGRLQLVVSLTGPHDRQGGFRPGCSGILWCPSEHHVAPAAVAAGLRRQHHRKYRDRGDCFIRVSRNDSWCSTKHRPV